MSAAKKILSSSIEKPQKKAKLPLKRILLVAALVGIGYWCSVVYQSAYNSREIYRRHPDYQEMKEAYKRGEITSKTGWFTYAD